MILKKIFQPIVQSLTGLHFSPIQLGCFSKIQMAKKVYKREVAEDQTFNLILNPDAQLLFCKSVIHLELLGCQAQGETDLYLFFGKKVEVFSISCKSMGMR